jgi:HSP20 family protein
LTETSKSDKFNIPKVLPGKNGGINMKKILSIAAVICLFASGLAVAQTDMTAKEEKELEELSQKLVRMKHAVDKFANELVSTYPAQGRSPYGGFGGDVRVDIVENEKSFLVTADLPGMDKDKITVTLESGRILRISGSREMVRTETGPNVVKQERMEGKFERVLELPAECKSDGISASYKNGVLEITILKKEPTKPETVKVNVQ